MEWMPITEALVLFFLAMGLPIAIFKLLEMRYDYVLLFRSRPWIRLWAFHLMIFAISLLEICWLSRGKLETYGLELGKVNLGWLGLSLTTAMGLFLIIYLRQIVTRTPIKIDYPLTPHKCIRDDVMRVAFRRSSRGTCRKRSCTDVSDGKLGWVH